MQNTIPKECTRLHLVVPSKTSGYLCEIDASSEFDAVADLLGLLAVIHKPCGLIDHECFGDLANDFAHRAGCSRCLGEAEDAKSHILTVGKDLETFDNELAWLDAIIYDSG
jgi:hypothetical protein